MLNHTIEIFLLDDDSDDLLFFENALGNIRLDYNLTTFNSGQTLLKALEDASPLPHIIFSDINMPLLSGFEVLAKLRELKHLENTPIIMYTTGSNLIEIEKASNLGANLFFIKPSKIKSLQDLLDKMLRINWEEFNKTVQINNFVVSEDSNTQRNLHN